MKSLLRTVLFRMLAPDDGAGGGAPAPTSASEGPVDFEALADAAYDAAERGDEPPDAVSASDEEDAETEPEESETDGDLPDDGLATVPDELVEKYPVVGHLRTLDEGLSDPQTAAETLRSFAQGVADHHGVDLGTMLGIAPAHDEKPEADGIAEPKPWWEAGFGSPDEYDGAADYERAGFASEGEYRLAQRLDALQAQVAPALQAQRRAASIAHYEALIGRATPHAVSAVRAQTGWTPTPEQVMQAARAYPQIAAQSLPQAVQTAFLKEIVAAARGKARAERPRPDDMPLGAPRRGTRGYEPPTDGSVNWNALADSAYEAATN